jgi:hypothetical protein
MLGADEWRYWMNPEIAFHIKGIRLEDQPEPVRAAVLKLFEASMSERGYQDMQAVMRTNAFLGQLVGA